MMLPTPGASATSMSDLRKSMRDSVSNDRIAPTCSPITKAAPITAAKICATSRVRLGPMVLNSAMVSATASAAAVKPTAATTP